VCHDEIWPGANVLAPCRIHVNVVLVTSLLLLAPFHQHMYIFYITQNNWQKHIFIIKTHRNLTKSGDFLLGVTGDTSSHCHMIIRFWTMSPISYLPFTSQSSPYTSCCTLPQNNRPFQIVSYRPISTSSWEKSNSHVANRGGNVYLRYDNQKGSCPQDDIWSNCFLHYFLALSTYSHIGSLKKKDRGTGVEDQFGANTASTSTTRDEWH